MINRLEIGAPYSDSNSNHQILQQNEGIKAVSGLCMSLGTALMIAGTGRWFYTAVDGHTSLWLVVGPEMIWSGLQVLTLLETECGDTA